ncbi:hypothetical protein ACHHYP_02454 [Achlya hypogyna]|uniref:Folate receptor-like domain-containing protein n=1 Tax=Achlya hypogyna TaxID=1202772 RepID=A0A1V9Z6B1_ACHHY|nr:hypothetical protein ACHHYP_02454 [Achlya hypogyna]
MATTTDETPRCRSTGGLKFDPAEPPRQQRPGAMEHCAKYAKNTCCNATHVLPLKRLVLEPLVAGVNGRCQELSEELTCSACHPLMGTSRMERVCPDLCDEWFDACKHEFYMAGNHHLAPCYGNALICSPLKDIVSTSVTRRTHVALIEAYCRGRDFCRRMGYTPGKATDTEGKDCFDGSVPDTLGVPEPAERVSDALFRIFEEQAHEPTEFVLLVLLGTMLSLFLSIKFFKRWYHAHTQLSLEQARARQQELYRQSYHFGKAAAATDATTDATTDAAADDSDFSDSDEEPKTTP